MPKPDARMSLCLNGHTLDGIKVKGKWQFTCSFAEIAKEHSGDSGLQYAVDVFVRRATREPAKEVSDG